MQKVYQTRFHGETIKGNSLAACLASLFDTSISDLPKFEDMGQEEWIEGMLQ